MDDDAHGYSGATVSLGDDILLYVLDILRIGWLLPWAAALLLAGPFAFAVLGLVIGPFAAWTYAVWSLFNTLRRSLDAGGRAGREGAPWRYRGLALAAIAVEVGVPIVPLVSRSPWTVVGVALGGPALLGMLALVAGALLKDGGPGADPTERAQDLAAG